jgi:hypothetical protein
LQNNAINLSKKRKVNLGIEKKKKKKRKKKKGNTDTTEGSRKSLRLKGLTPDGGELSLPVTAKEIQEEREARVVECREARLKAANEVAKAGYSKAAMENPTASYEHCAMRVRTMTEKVSTKERRRGNIHHQKF